MHKQWQVYIFKKTKDSKGSLNVIQHTELKCMYLRHWYSVGLPLNWLSRGCVWDAICKYSTIFNDVVRMIPSACIYQCHVMCTKNRTISLFAHKYFGNAYNIHLDIVLTMTRRVVIICLSQVPRRVLMQNKLLMCRAHRTRNPTNSTTAFISRIPVINTTFTTLNESVNILWMCFGWQKYLKRDCNHGNVINLYKILSMRARFILSES